MNTYILKKGFTLIEVLIALAILAIGLTALLKNTSNSINGTRMVKEKLFAHWVSMNAIASLQLGLVPIQSKATHIQKTELFHQTWYWKATIQPTRSPTMEKIIITTSPLPNGPFSSPTIAFRTNANA